eukprot:6052992-Ditylum_brightwellii.AAC.1
METNKEGTGMKKCHCMVSACTAAKKHAATDKNGKVAMDTGGDDKNAKVMEHKTDQEKIKER